MHDDEDKKFDEDDEFDKTFLNDEITEEKENVSDIIVKIVNAVSEILQKKEKDSNTKKAIKQVSDSITNLLLYKNKKYGNSAIEPLHIFDKGTSSTCFINIDNKLARIKNSPYPRVNDESDVIGYLMLDLAKRYMDGENIIEQIEEEKD